MSRAETPVRFIPATDDRWALLSEPPGVRDLAIPGHWDVSRERSQRRRDASRRLVVLADRGGARLGLALTAIAVGGSGAAVTGAVGTAPAAAASHALHQGSRGRAVKTLQRALGVTADGAFGPGTKRALKRYQRAHGLTATGVVDTQTRQALGLRRGGHSKRRHAKGLSLTSDQTKALQQALGVTADGEIGPATRRALKAYETDHGMHADGKPDAAVLAALGVDTGGSGSDSSQDAPAAPAPSGSAEAIVAATRAQVGAPYASGGTTPKGFDCSGLTRYVFKQAGIGLPRSSFQQYKGGVSVPRADIAPGDLVFFDSDGPGASHVGVATGAKTVISATSHGVMEHSITHGYWRSHYVGARRVS